MLRMKVAMHMFDRQILKYNWNRINHTPLTRAGLLVRKIMRGDIRRRPYGKTSPVGSAPYSHQPGGTPPFKMIYSVPDLFQTRVVIGMIGFGTRLVPVPGLHEHGGRKVSLQRTERGMLLAAQLAASRKRRKGPPRTPSPGRSAAIKAILKRVPMMVSYRQRPFANPALMKARAIGISGFWFNCFRSDTVLKRMNTRTIRHVYGPTSFVRARLFR